MTGGSRPRPIVLVVLDGFGIGHRPEADAIAAASMPRWRDLLAHWPHATLQASEGAVGLPVGQMGNSEVGHLNLGAGRPVLQDLPRIDAAIEDGTFFDRPALNEACDRAIETGRLHTVGLVGPGGVHAHDRHLIALVELAARRGVPSVRIHALLDGRDTPPRSAIGYVTDLEQRLARCIRMRASRPLAAATGPWIATGGGIVRSAATTRSSMAPASTRRRATAAIEAAYGRGENDEFVAPTVVDGVDGALRDRDPIVHVNFRADRARQLTHALADRDFDDFDRASPEGRPAPSDLLVVTMTEYESGLPVEVAFGPEEARSLARAFSEAGWTQFHVAETEKYAHVTYFFNGGREAAWPGEERRLVPSPKVATYDLQPEMSARGVTDELVAAIESGRYDFIVANYANPDMVAHTGVWEATIRALEMIDECLGRVAGRRRARGGGGPRWSRCRPPDHRRSRQCRRASGPGRKARHRAFAQPGAAGRPGAKPAPAIAARRRPGRRGPDHPRDRGAAALGRDDRPVPAGRWLSAPGAGIQAVQPGRRPPRSAGWRPPGLLPSGTVTPWRSSLP